MSFTTILYTGLLALGLFTADVWLHSDIINLDLSLPKGAPVNEASIGEDVGENIFLMEIAQIEGVPTFIAPPKMRSRREASATVLLSDILGLKRLTQLVQKLTGVTSVTISGALIRQQGRLQLVLVSNPSTPRALQINLTVTGAPDEPLTRLVQRAAVETMLRYDDYLACLYLMTQAAADALATYEPSLESPGLEGLDRLIQSRLVIRPQGLAAFAQADGFSRREAMFTNLRGIVALEQGNINGAARFFADATKSRPDFAIAHINRAFIMIQQGHYDEAVDISRRLLSDGSLDSDPVLQASVQTTWGVAAWGLKRYDEAANHFAQAVQAYPQTSAAYIYWSELLNVRGLPVEAAERLRLAKPNTNDPSNYAEMAMFHFRLSPDNKSPLTRF
jgi:tetratricopeptide (TPR) repeat protein